MIPHERVSASGLLQTPTRRENIFEMQNFVNFDVEGEWVWGLPVLDCRILSYSWTWLTVNPTGYGLALPDYRLNLILLQFAPKSLEKCFLSLEKPEKLIKQKSSLLTQHIHTALSTSSRSITCYNSAKSTTLKENQQPSQQQQQKTQRDGDWRMKKNFNLIKRLLTSVGFANVSRWGLSELVLPILSCRRRFHARP